MIPLIASLENFFENAGLLLVVIPLAYIAGWCCPPKRIAALFKK